MVKRDECTEDNCVPVAKLRENIESLRRFMTSHHNESLTKFHDIRREMDSKHSRNNKLIWCVLIAYMAVFGLKAWADSGNKDAIKENEKQIALLVKDLQHLKDNSNEAVKLLRKILEKDQ